MASNLPFYSVSLVVTLAVLALSASPVCSTPQQAPESPKLNKSGFWVKLKQVDTSNNLTQFERIQKGIRYTNGLLAYHELRSISSPVKSYLGISRFFIEFSIGTPRKTQSLSLDTGTDLTWIQCEPCIYCFEQNNPIFHPNESSSFSNLSSSSELCKALPQPIRTDDGCEYFYKYLDESSTHGIMAHEKFTFGEAIVPNVGFGCGLENEADHLSPRSGVVGLGRGPLSLVSLLKETKFAYCLPSFEDPKNSGRLVIGSLEKISVGELKTTPLIRNSLDPSAYYISLEGVSIGGTKLHIEKSITLKDDGTGGLCIDSGIPITYLEETAYDLVREEFINQFKLSEDKSGKYVFDLCFNLPEEGSEEVEVPELIFHFDGADLDLPRQNYMIEDKITGVLCLGISPSRWEVSMFGALQQQNMLVIHDLEKETLSFVPTECD